MDPKKNKTEWIIVTLDNFLTQSTEDIIYNPHIIEKIEYIRGEISDIVKLIVPSKAYIVYSKHPGGNKWTLITTIKVNTNGVIL